MNRNSIPSIRWQIIIFLVFLSAYVLAEKYEKTTKCVYTSIEGVSSFEFICEPNKTTKEYFTNGSPIYCDSVTGHSFYKERRHEIRFRNCEWKQLPVIFMWYKAVRLLNVSSLGLESLRGKNFDYSINLQTFIASHNRLTELSASLFDDAKKLGVVDLSYNQINRIDPLTFNTDNKVTLLNLSNNLLVGFDNQTFAKFSQLEDLNLNSNLIVDIPDGLFDNLIQLRYLNLGNNLVKQLKCSAFCYLINLKTLDLTRNKLQAFDANCIRSEKSFALFIEANELQHLHLSRNVSEINASANNITKISIMENDLSNMTVFNISKNKVENIVEVIEQFSSQLIILDVADSIIGKLNVSTFETFDNLEYLSLRNTNLSNIQYGTFHHQQKLRYLDLSGNYLKEINFGMLHWNSENLERLYLDGNYLDDLSNLTKANYPSLEYVSIDSNNFSCDYLSEVQREWKRERISVVPNPHIQETPLQNAHPHVNGITCNYNSVLTTTVSTLPTTVIIDSYKGNDGSKVSYMAATTIDTSSISLGKIELLLVCIVIVLVCILIVIIIKNFGPIFKRMNSVQEYGSEPIYYIPKIEEQSLL